jgi:antitoxin HicB
MLEYRIELTPDDNDTFLVRCPQLPIVVTYGESEEEAKHHAVDAIETALASMIDDGEDIPRPDQSAGIRVRLPLLTALKVNLYWAIREAGVTRAELARRLNWNRESVDRLFRLDHLSRMEQIEAAFDKLDMVPTVSVVSKSKYEYDRVLTWAMERLLALPFRNEPARFELAIDQAKPMVKLFERAS